MERRKHLRRRWRRVADAAECDQSFFHQRLEKRLHLTIQSPNLHTVTKVFALEPNKPQDVPQRQCAYE